MTLQRHAENLAEKTFLGGRAEVFEAIGRLQLITLLRCGLYPDSRVLDLGCGCLRGGYWIIHFLSPDRYFGIEPNVEMLEIGKSEILGSEVLAEKRPRFLSNDQFDPSEFGGRFDFFIARSVWTHASRGQIEKMLDAFLEFGSEDGVFLTSFLPLEGAEGELNSEWVGRSHESDTPGTVRHDRRWIGQECRHRNFSVSELIDPRQKQVWLLISKGEGAKPSQTYLEKLVDVPSDDSGAFHSLRSIAGSIRRRLARVAKRIQAR